MGNNTVGHPKIWKTAEELASDGHKFTTEIKENGFVGFPSLSNFADWKGCDRRSVYNALHEYFPNIKKQFMDDISDCLAQGAAVGRYQPTITIFTLKNWCDWADKQEQKIEAKAEVKGVEDFFAQFEDEGRKF